MIRRQMENHWVISAVWSSKTLFYLLSSVDDCGWSALSFQVYWLGPMCAGIAAALIYDFLLCPRTHSLNTRRSVLLNGSEIENNAPELREGNSSPGPSQWPKHWTSCNILTHLQTTCDLKICIKFCFWFLSFFFFFCSVLLNCFCCLFVFFNKKSFSSCFHLKIFHSEVHSEVNISLFTLHT